MNDVILNKAASIERCVKRAREEYRATDDFLNDYTRQDAAVLNIIRACEQSIDLANYLVREHQLGLPNSSRESFTLLAQAGWYPTSLSEALEKMVGFRNVVVHEYQQVKIKIIQAVIERNLDSLLQFTQCVLTKSS
ncbi:DUF86 domain-containing protein [Pontibacterium sp.]|uniref:type VII toxin-antitoxin system HepT family RNase toxin n=1 Tax=Pontibacterium sp. TaxID=2036026 RepID=UPI0035135CB2